MKIYLASDHDGFALKGELLSFLSSQGFDVVDCGPFSYEKDDDYPDFISKAAEFVSENPQNKAIVLGMSGQGEAVVANKFKKVRAVVFYGGPKEIITLSREHNDANILSLGANFLTVEEAKDVVGLWLKTEFSGEERHERRIRKINTVVSI